MIIYTRRFNLFLLYSIKEYADYANFNIQEYMMNNQISYLSPKDADEAFNKEKQEYIEAKNRVDTFHKEVNQSRFDPLSTIALINYD